MNTAVFPDPEAVTANVLAVHRHLGGALMPEPVPAPDGAWLVWDGSSPWRAWRRAPGAPLAGAAASSKALFAAGFLLGRFHTRLADLDAATLTETLPNFHDPGRRLDQLRAAIAADPCGRVAAVQPEIAEALAGERLVAVAADLGARVPRRVAHFDAKLDNILFARPRPRARLEAVGLVDFDTVMPGAWFWDVGDLLRSASSPAAEDDPERSVAVPALYRAVLDGSTGPVPAEREAVGHAGAIVTYEQAVRFLTDWIAGDVYYRISRPEQNLDRARAQFRLLASMPLSRIG